MVVTAGVMCLWRSDTLVRESDPVLRIRHNASVVSLVKKCGDGGAFAREIGTKQQVLFCGKAYPRCSK